MSDKVLIRPITYEYAKKDTVPEGFISRDEFINRTGIFVSPGEYEFIYKYEYCESNLSLDDFINGYAERMKDEIMEIELTGTLKFLPECKSYFEDYYGDDFKPNIWEYLSCIERKVEKATKYNLEVINELGKLIESVAEKAKEAQNGSMELSMLAIEAWL